MHLAYSCKSTACLPEVLRVTTSCPGMCCQQTQHALIWAAFSLHMAWSAWHLHLQGATMLMGYKTWVNPDTDVPWLVKHLVGLSDSLSHPGDNYLTRHCSLCPSPPSCHANRSQSVKCHGSLARICAQLLPPPHCLLPVLLVACNVVPVLMLLGHWNKGLGLLFLMGTAGFWEAHRGYFLIKSSHCGLGRDCCFSPRHFIN